MGGESLAARGPYTMCRSGDWTGVLYEGGWCVSVGGGEVLCVWGVGWGDEGSPFMNRLSHHKYKSPKQFL